MSDSMKRRVKDALLDYVLEYGTTDWDEMALEAIKAMREPTEAMKNASDKDGPWRFQHPASVWRVMTDAALSEKP